MIEIHYGIFMIAALSILLLPLDWVLAIVFAAVFHELCHILVLYAFGGKIQTIRVLPRGAVIETDRISAGKQFVSILIGPIGSFSLLFLCRVLPKLAICGFFHGFYNLVPVMPLDGGRLLKLLLYRFCPVNAERYMKRVAIVVCVAVDLLAVWISIVISSTLFPMFLALAWNIKYLPRKFPCKPSKIGVQ